MNIKSILLGSAAALVAVTGARAADAVVMVEPEPVEYVRVCDVYGTGFFYIPGTETCLKISGYVRMRLQARDEVFNTFGTAGLSPDPDSNDDYQFTTRTRARLDFDAREETELGTLRAKIRVQASNNSSGDNFSGNTNAGTFAAEEAFIQLGGLTIGFLDSVWTGGEGGIEDGLLTDSTFAPGDVVSNHISYTYAANGFSGTLSVEDDGDGDFTPDVIAKLAYTGGFGGVYLQGVFDEDSRDVGGTRFATDPLGNRYTATFFTDEYTTALFNAETDEEAFALKAGILLENLLVEDSAFKINGLYAFDPTVYAFNADVFGYNGGNLSGGAGVISSEYQIDASYSQSFGKLFAGIGGFYGETFEVFTDVPNDGVIGARNVGSLEYYGGVVNVGYEITSNFSVLGEVTYRDVDVPVGIDDFDQVGGFLEFKRTF